ncbi:MAG: iolE 3 [Mucilaginibacter sp.]|nr:iolE 3 [Mucilaginibacter sp.]
MYKAFKMINRKQFLKQVGLLSAGALAMPYLANAAPGKKVGLQLYSLRDQLPKDVKGVISKVAAAGYAGIETFGYTKSGGFWGLDAKTFSTLLKSNGLTTASGHYGMEQYFTKGNTDDLKTYIDAAHNTGQTYIVCPHLGEEYRKTPDDLKKVAARLNTIGQLFKSEGLKLAYHNHDFEFIPVGGSTLYDVILKETDPQLVKLEMDIYWVVRAGHDPATLLNQHPGRYVMVHIKDMDKQNHKLNTEIGSGIIDFKKMIPATKKAGVTNYILEQENYIDIDPYISITKSAAYIKNNLL